MTSVFDAVAGRETSAALGVTDRDLGASVADDDDDVDVDVDVVVDVDVDVDVVVVVVVAVDDSGDDLAAFGHCVVGGTVAGSDKVPSEVAGAGVVVGPSAALPHKC